MSECKFLIKNHALSPFHFTSSAISPEIKQFNQSISEQIANLPPFVNLSPQEIRAREEQFLPEKSSIAQDRYITGSNGHSVKVRQIIPDKIKGVYLFIHGGGWTSGACDRHDIFLEKIALEAQLAVISVGYRLAPEHPYPAAVDDCEEVALWLIENSTKEFGTDNILVGGGSAGAHLCVLTLLRMRDKHSYSQFKGANLVFGIYDLAMTPSARNWGEKELILSTPILEKLINYFLPNTINRYDPTVSPIYADLHNMPPALFTVGTLDPLLDDSLFMYQRWLAAGNQAELALCPGGVHGFTVLPTPQAHEARANIIEFLKGTTL